MKRKNFLFFIILLLIFIYINTPANAQEIIPSLTVTKKATPSVFVKYDLAYPGILPDHPLYKLKVLRDKVSASLISDPRKKIDFYLLQADKGILATAMLIDQNKIELAESSVLKAEHNFTVVSNVFQSYYDREQADFSKSNTKDLVKKLKNASEKHQEVLNSLIKRVPKDRQKTFTTVLDFSKRNINSIEKKIEDYKLGKNNKKIY